MENFKGQITISATSLLEENSIPVTLLPPNTPDLLWAIDNSVNKPAKEYQWRQFGVVFRGGDEVPGREDLETQNYSSFI